MASASPVSPGETLRASSGKDNFTRLARLLICGGTRILREYFDSCHPPAILPTWLRTPAVEQSLDKLKKKRVLSLAQWKLLYPSSTMCGTSESFDITLLFTLIRELVVLTPPALGWDNLPADTDLTLPADLARIKYYRNTLAHGNENMELTGDEFDEYWEQLEGALLRIVKNYAGNTSSAVKNWETAINDLFKSSISKEKGVNNLLGNPEAELAMESRYFQNLDARSLLSTMEDLPQRTGSEVTRQMQNMNKERSPKEVSVRCILKAATWGAVVVGTSYIFFQYKDDPEELRKMIKEVLLPVGLLAGTIAIGSIKIGLRAESLEALEGLLIRYKSGKLEKDLAKVFMTEELKKATNGEVIEFRVEMNENDYRTAYCEMLWRDPKQAKLKTETHHQLLQEVERERDFLKLWLDKFIDCSRAVAKYLHDQAEKLNKLNISGHSTVGAAGEEVGKQKTEIIMEISEALDTAIKEIKTALQNVHASIGRLKSHVEYLKTYRSQRLIMSEESKLAKRASSEFDKLFQIHEPLLLPALDLSPQYLGLKYIAVHQRDLNTSEVEKVLEMAKDLETQLSALDKNNANDIVEKYLDELFMCRCTRTCDAENRLKSLEEKIEVFYRMCVQWIDNRQEARRDLTMLADKLKYKQQRNVNQELVGAGFAICGFVASFFLYGASFITSIAIAGIMGLTVVLVASGGADEFHWTMLLIEKCKYRDIRFNKDLQYFLSNLEIELNSIEKDELDEIQFILADESKVIKSESESRKLVKRILYDSIRATFDIKQPFGTGASRLRKCLQRGSGFAKWTYRGTPDIYTFARQLSDSTKGAEKKIRKVVEEMSSPDRDEIPDMIKEYITQSLLGYQKPQESLLKEEVKRLRKRRISSKKLTKTSKTF